jgi:iron-sulfur cluster repair protein YtfE (RIC family)
MDNTENVDRVGQLLSDHRALLSCICGLRDWTREVSEWGMPRFGELGSRLVSFRAMLADHFADEESGKYSEIVLGPAARTALELSSQHQQILKRLDRLIESLRAPEPEFQSWQDAVQQVESIITEICDHEEHESGVLQSSKSEASATKTSTA